MIKQQTLGPKQWASSDHWWGNYSHWWGKCPSS